MSWALLFVVYSSAGLFVRGDLPGSSRSRLYYGSSDGRRSTEVCSASWIDEEFVHAMVQEITMEDGYPAVRFVTHWKPRTNPDDGTRTYKMLSTEFTKFSFQKLREREPITEQTPWTWPNFDVRHVRNEFRESNFRPSVAGPLIFSFAARARQSYQEIFIARFPPHVWPVRHPNARDPYRCNYVYDHRDVQKDTKELSELRDRVMHNIVTNDKPVAANQVLRVPQMNVLGRNSITWNSGFCNMIDDVNILDRIWRQLHSSIFWFKNERVPSDVRQFRIWPEYRVQSVHLKRENFLFHVKGVQVRLRKDTSQVISLKISISSRDAKYNDIGDSFVVDIPF